MNNSNDRSHIRWFEHPWYWLVSLLLVVLGVLQMVVKMLLFPFRQFGKLWGTIFALLVIAVSVIIWMSVSLHTTVDLGSRVVSVIVKPGDSFVSVAGRLHKDKVVNSTFWLKAWARRTGVDRKLTPGRYDFTGENSCLSLLETLEQARFVRYKITIPEGSTIWQTASILSDTLDFDSADFVSLNTDASLLKDLKIPHLEGYLFPQTYFIAWGTTARQAAVEMVTMFAAQTDSLWADQANMSLSREDVITLASIVEAEARLDHERSTIASVYQNRLRINMKLDADPTVIYGLGGLDRPLYRRDLEKDIPYNTYLHKGLPPTPINSPGLESIRAVLHPDSTDFFFFVADNTGGHTFSRTNAEHNRARERIKREAASQ